MERIIDGFKFGLGFGCAMLVFYAIAIAIMIWTSLGVPGLNWLFDAVLRVVQRGY